MQLSNAPTKVTVPFANSGTKNAIPTASQIGVTPGAASYTDGFPPLTFTPLASGGVPPAGADFNGILNAITASVRWGMAGGLYAYDGTFSTAVGGYPRGAIVNSADATGAWRNLTDNNTTNPDSGGTGWITAFPAGVVGATRNLRGYLSTGGTSLNLTADEVIVETVLGGQYYRIANLNLTVNLATTGANGMDTGTAPASGYVGVYVIFNPSTGASALLATNATASVVGNVYGGANMPAGYTASALVAVWPTTSGSILYGGLLADRKFTRAAITVLSTSSTTGTYTALAIGAGVPRNAKSVDLGINITQSGGTAVSEGCTIATDASAVGAQLVQAAANQLTQLVGWVGGIQMATVQTVYYTWVASGAGSNSLTVYVTGYTF
jgi:hypothetical protein